MSEVNVQRILRLRKRLAGAGLLVVGIALLNWLAPRQTSTAQDVVPPTPEHMQPVKNFSPYADRNYPTRVYWGDQHLHTSFPLPLPAEYEVAAATLPVLQLWRLWPLKLSWATSSPARL